MRIRGIVAAVGLFAAGYACGGGGGASSLAAQTLFELNGGSLARQLEGAGSPPITAGFGIAERVPEDGTRHFTLAVATENREAQADAVALYTQTDGHGRIGGVWGANIVAVAHSDMESGVVQGLEVDGAAPELVQVLEGVRRLLEVVVRARMVGVEP